MSYDWGHINIIKRGYKPTWISKPPRQRIAVVNPTISAKASSVLDNEVHGLLR